MEVSFSEVSNQPFNILLNLFFVKLRQGLVRVGKRAVRQRDGRGGEPGPRAGLHVRRRRGAGVPVGARVRPGADRLAELRARPARLRVRFGVPVPARDFFGF